ncbi:MAG TPA: hypothetical protein VMH86_05180 [Rhizomicrobium sp.]|nr:hypothetical protein [Rhizomicrobium sp.]
MRGMALLGVLLIVLGIVGLAFDHFSYTETKPVLKAGPLQVDTQEHRSIAVPLAGSIVLLVVGAGLVIVARRRA